MRPVLRGDGLRGGWEHGRHVTLTVLQNSVRNIEIYANPK